MTTDPAALRAALTPVLAAVRGLFGAAACSCALADPDGSTLTFVAADGAGADRIVGVSLPVSRGIAGFVALSGQPLAVSDVSRDERFARDVAESTDYVPTTILAVPVTDLDGDTAGVLEVLDPAGPRGEARLGEWRGAGAELAVLAVVATLVGRILERDDADETSAALAGLDGEARAALTQFLGALGGRRR